MTKTVEFEKPARKALRRMPRPTAERVVSKFEQYSMDPTSFAAQVKAPAGDYCKRLRVGDWRVLFVEDHATIVVIDVLPRGSAYRP